MQAVQLPHEATPCQRYAGDPDLLGYCLVQRVGRVQFGDPDLETACGQAGPWATLCRSQWAHARALSAKTQDIAPLLEICDTEDCRFQVIDAWNDPDVPAQLALCDAHLSTFAGDCARHTLSRWWLDRPTQAQVAVLQHAQSFPHEVGTYLGFLAACRGMGTCVGDPQVVAGCQEGLARVARVGGICSEAPIRPNQRSPREPDGWVLPAGETAP